MSAGSSVPFLRHGDDGLRGEAPHRVYLLAIAVPPHAGRRAYPVSDIAGPSFGVGVFFSADPGDRSRLDQARRTQRALLERCLELGGRPYLAGAHEVGEEILAACHGAEHDALVAARDAVYPVLNTGVGLGYNTYANPFVCTPARKQSVREKYTGREFILPNIESGEPGKERFDPGALGQGLFDGVGKR